MSAESVAIYKKIKGRTSNYDEEIHCPMILDVMNDRSLGTLSAFCVQALISESTAYLWMKKNPVFAECYLVGKAMARQNWEDDGRGFEGFTVPMGTISHAFEYWRTIGWSRFGVGKTPRIRLDLDPDDNPNNHYAQLLKQAASGDFTAGEIKQLMEAVNVGLNAHQVFTLQKEIDELKSNLAKMTSNMNENNTFPNKGT